MNSRKQYKYPFSKRHVRRLKATRRELFFQEVNTTFLDNVDVTVEHECLNTYNRILICNSPMVSPNVSNNEMGISHSDLIFKDLGSNQNLPLPSESVTLQPCQSMLNEDGYINVGTFEQKDAVQGDSYDAFIAYLTDDNVTENSDSENESENLEVSTNEKDNKNLRFRKNIQLWCIKYVHAIPHAAINDLLRILQSNTNAAFPSDARTLLKTDRCTQLINMDNGQYCHFGIKKAVLIFLTEIVQKNIDFNCIQLLVNIDGAPLAHSSEKGVWIISVSETVLKKVEVVGIYHGPDKPSNCNELLQMFTEELTELINEGIQLHGKHYQVQFHGLICDTPAKAYVLFIKYHTGYWSCTKCTIKGSWIGKMCFPGDSGTERTDVRFKQNLYMNDGLNEGLQQGTSNLSNIPNFGPVTNVPLDYMHLVCLGVMLKLIELWTNGSLTVKLSVNQRKQISERLINLRNFMPSDFSRKPRKFENARRLWKAHELRQFLLYSGPVVLVEVLRQDLYDNFLCLHIAISILINPILCTISEYLDLCDKLLKKFVKEYEILYGSENVSYNIHNLLHIVSDVKKFGPLDNFSSFRFENHIRKVKQLIRQGNKPLQQISRRLSEINEFKEYAINEENDEFILQNRHEHGPLLPCHENVRQFKILKKGSLNIKSYDSKNNCVLLKEGIFVECCNFVEKNNTMYIVGKPFKIKSDFYLSPVSSNILSIKVVQSCTNNFELYPCKNISMKVCKIPLKNVFVLFPMMHTYYFDEEQM